MPGSDMIHYMFGEKYNTNIGAYFEIDKITFEEFQKKVFQRGVTAIPHMRQIPVRLLAIHFWKDVDVTLGKNQVIKETMKFQSKDEVLKYFNDVCCSDLDYNKPLFEFRVIEDYTEDSSMILYRSHHMFGDGIAISSLFSTLNDDQFSTQASKKVFNPSFWQSVKLSLT